MHLFYLITKQTIFTALLASIPFTVVSAATGVIEDDTLTISGSPDDDWITVTGFGSGMVEVSSGRQADALVGSFENVANLIVNAKKGNNRITLNEVSVPGTVTVTAHAGNDKLDFTGDFTAGENLIVDLNGGNNVVTAKRNASIYTGGHAQFDGNKGIDKVTLTSVSIGGKLILDTAGGADVIKLGKKNKHTVTIGADLMVLSGRGKNNINIQGASVSNSISLISGGDADKYTVNHSSAGTFFDLRSGGGKDRITSKNNTVSGEYNVHCGSGKDKLISNNNQATTILQQRCVN